MEVSDNTIFDCKQSRALSVHLKKKIPIKKKKIKQKNPHTHTDTKTTTVTDKMLRKSPAST